MKSDVDKVNQLKVQYRFSHHYMKLCKRESIFFLDTTVVNALINYKTFKPTTTHLTFRKVLITNILHYYKRGFMISNINNNHDIGRRKSSNCVVCWKENKEHKV